MEAQLNTSSEEKKLALEKAAAEQIAAIQKAVEDVKETNLQHQKQIEEATMTEKGNLEAQLEQCKQTNKAYLEEVAVHLEKYNLLEQQFNESKNFALNGLKELVEKLGIEDIASLEKTIQDILDKKGPDETGTGEPGTISPLNRMDSTDVTLEDAQRTLEHSESFTSGKFSPQETIQKIDAADAAAAERKKAREERKKKREDKKKARHKMLEDTKREQSEFEQITQKKPGAKQAWVEEKIDKTKYGSHKDHMATKQLLLKDVDTFISGIDSPDKMTKLINNVIQNHGIHNTKKKDYHKELARFKDGRLYKNIRKIYKKALVGIIEGGLEQEVYVEIVDKINETSVEEVFEELLAAFHLVYSTNKIGNVYSMGASGGLRFQDSDYTRNGKVAAYIWKPRKDEYFNGSLLKNNGRKNDDNKMAQMITVKMHDYIHSHDKAGEGLKKSASKSLYNVGGFRHGKRSQKKNKRTLKSKLTAKKYSLKVGKKKKGKKGNKSKKRRKSIKIRI